MHLSSTAQYDEAEGTSTKLSFDEALGRALDALPPQPGTGTADEQSHVEVISTRVDVGGIVPRILVVRVRRARMPETFLCRDWEAWHDRTPGGTPTLYVHGVCVVPSAGFTAKLQRKAPQGINPSDLLLDLTVTPPPNKQKQERTMIEANYREATPTLYQTVTIIGAGPGSVTLPVRQVF